MKTCENRDGCYTTSRDTTAGRDAVRKKPKRESQLVLPDVDGPIFLADLDGVPSTQNQGLYAVMPDGSVLRVVAKGDSLPFRNGAQKTVKTIGVFQQPAEAVGQSRSFDASTGTIVYQATFTDGTWGIYRATFP